MTTHKSTDRKDSDSSVQRELSYPSRHALFSVTQWKLPKNGYPFGNDFHTSASGTGIDSGER